MTLQRFIAILWASIFLAFALMFGPCQVFRPQPPEPEHASTAPASDTP